MAPPTITSTDSDSNLLSPEKLSKIYKYLKVMYHFFCHSIPLSQIIDLISCPPPSQCAQSARRVIVVHQAIASTNTMTKNPWLVIPRMGLIWLSDWRGKLEGLHHMGTVWRRKWRWMMHLVLYSPLMSMFTEFCTSCHDLTHCPHQAPLDAIWWDPLEHYCNSISFCK